MRPAKCRRALIFLADCGKNQIWHTCDQKPILNWRTAQSSVRPSAEAVLSTNWRICFKLLGTSLYSVAFEVTA